MNKHFKIFVVLVVVGLAGIVFAWLKLPELQEKMQQATSDSADLKGTIRVGYDSWVGYFPLCSPEMRRRLRTTGYRLQCEDDKADYAARFSKLKQHELDFALATVDSYILNGNATDYPGVIVAVIDESKGGDAIIANAEVVPDLNALKTPVAAPIAFTPNSPSEHLLKAMSTFFDLPLYSGSDRAWQMQTDGSEAALKKLQKGEANVAVLWEPDVSRALQDSKFIKLIGTDETDKLIVDILLVDRQFSQQNSAVVEVFLKTYFDTLKFYIESADELLDDLKKETRLKEPQIEAMLKGVSWAGLGDNGLDWFGATQNTPGASDSLVDGINTAIEVLVDNGDFRANPLPSSDPYRIISSQYVSALHSQRGGAQAAVAGGDSLSADFPPLEQSAWRKLKKVGTLKTEAVSFRRGTNSLDVDGIRSADDIAGKIRRYPKFRIIIEGHTSLSGDPQANLELSADRARAVANHLVQNFDVDPDRVRAVGYGASRPLDRLPGESSRAYGYRLPRVEISLRRESY